LLEDVANYASRFLGFSRERQTSGSIGWDNADRLCNLPTGAAHPEQISILWWGFESSAR